MLLDRDDARRLPQTANFRPYFFRRLTRILVHMPRRLRNWNYRNVIDFLKTNDFRFSKPLDGSHERWIKVGQDGQSDITVEINFTHSSYPLKTLDRIIRQSGLGKDEWMKWGGT